MIYLYALPGAFFAPIIHEWVKAMCTVRLGDRTPKSKGFLSGNPLRYFEPVGFFLMLMVGFGWGQPVPTSPLYYKDRRKGILVTYITPSVVNLLAGLAAAAVYRLIFQFVLTGGDGVGVQVLDMVSMVIYYFAQLNIGLAFFNLIPIYPMDGAKILQLFISPAAVVSMNRYEKFAQVILLLLLFMGLPQTYILNPLIQAVLSVPFLF